MELACSWQKKASACCSPTFSRSDTNSILACLFPSLGVVVPGSSRLTCCFLPCLRSSFSVSFVGKFLKRNERGNDSTPVRFTNVFVKNIDPEVTEAQLSEAFQSVGRITNAVIMRDEAGNSKGFGFVNYDTPEEVNRGQGNKCFLKAQQSLCLLHGSWAGRADAFPLAAAYCDSMCSGLWPSHGRLSDL